MEPKIKKSLTGKFLKFGCSIFIDKAVPYANDNKQVIAKKTILLNNFVNPITCSIVISVFQITTKYSES